MARHHIVPQMTLRRFADTKERIVMRRRSDWSRVPATIRRACAESDFYAIPTNEVEESHQQGHDPEIVEQILSKIEGAAKAVFDRLLGGDVPLTAHDKYELSLFLSIQITRGWAYRESMQELRDIAVPYFVDEALSDERIREHLSEYGEAADDDAVMTFREQVRNSDITLEVSQAGQVQQSLRDAMRVVLPRLFSRYWRILKFNEPCLLTSDSPFAYWAPPGVGDGAFGVGNAPVVYYPIDRQTAIAMHQEPVSEKIVTSGMTRARQINRRVAAEAAKWVFHHPDDDPLAGEQLTPSDRYTEEVVSRGVEGNRVRELRMAVRRSDVTDLDE